MSPLTRVSPPNSLVLISDPAGGQPPAEMGKSLIAATDTCLAVGCKAADDGETEISLDVGGTSPPGLQLMFEGKLKTLGRAIAVRTVLGATLLEMTVRSAQTGVRIWANDPLEPDRIAIEICEQSEVAI